VFSGIPSIVTVFEILILSTGWNLEWVKKGSIVHKKTGIRTILSVRPTIAKKKNPQTNFSGVPEAHNNGRTGFM
jgi:hypothetical protein